MAEPIFPETERRGVERKLFLYDPILASASGYVGNAVNNKAWTQEMYSPIRSNPYSSSTAPDSIGSKNGPDSTRYAFKISSWVEAPLRNNIDSQDMMDVDTPKDFFHLENFDRFKKDQAQKDALSVADIRGAVGTGGDSIPGLSASTDAQEKEEPNPKPVEEDVNMDEATKLNDAPAALNEGPQNGVVETASQEEKPIDVSEPEKEGLNKSELQTDLSGQSKQQANVDLQNSDQMPPNTAASSDGPVELPKEQGQLQLQNAQISLHSTMEQSTGEQPTAEQSATEQPVTEQPVTEQPVTEQPVTEQPVTEQPVTEQPVTEQPVTEQPVTEQPVTEQPVTEQPVVEQPVIEQPVVEQPVIEQPVTEQPVIEATQNVTSKETAETSN
ncbi:hypothetical protein ACO0QE_001642 [Hanseniaspora vineae]